MDIIDVEVKPRVVSVPLEGTQIKRSEAELRRTFFQCPGVRRGFTDTRAPLIQQPGGGYRQPSSPRASIFSI